MAKRFLLIGIMILLLMTPAIANSIRVGGHKIIYDEFFVGDSDYDGIDDRTTYYLEDVLVFSSYDINHDGKADMWFTYTEGTYPEFAMRDTTGDGKPEDVITFNEAGDIIAEDKRTNLPWVWIFLGALLVAGILIYYVLRKKEEPEVKPKKSKKSNSKKK